MRRIIFTSLWVVLSVCVYSQSNFVTLGNDLSNSNASLSISIGQLDYSYTKNEKGSLSQGLQQIIEIIDETDATFHFSNVEIKVFPNPASTHLTLSAQIQKSQKFSFTISDQKGRLISKETISKELTQISIEHLPTGIYFINISDSNKLLKAFKIIKNQ